MLTKYNSHTTFQYESNYLLAAFTLESTIVIVVGCFVADNDDDDDDAYQRGKAIDSDG